MRSNSLAQTDSHVRLLFSQRAAIHNGNNVPIKPEHGTSVPNKQIKSARPSDPAAQARRPLNAP
jgi:hypothetical protein